MSVDLPEEAPAAVDDAEIAPAPANVNGVDGRFFHGVIKREEDLVVALKTQELLELVPG